MGLRVCPRVLVSSGAPRPPPSYSRLDQSQVLPLRAAPALLVELPSRPRSRLMDIVRRNEDFLRRIVLAEQRDRKSVV